MQDTETVVVVVAAGAGHPVLPDLPTDAYVIAADGGVDTALALGLSVDVAVGDLDSVTPAGLIEAEERGALIERHPTAKDATDLELALNRAIEQRPARIVVVGSAGGRLDHLASSLLLIADDRYAGPEVDAHLGEAIVHVVRGSRELHGTRGELITLLAAHGPAAGVRTEGLAYPLAGETLEAGSSRGVSNVFATETARVTVETGVVLVIRPGSEQ